MKYFFGMATALLVVIGIEVDPAFIGAAVVPAFATLDNIINPEG
jgi:hypothetical protein